MPDNRHLFAKLFRKVCGEVRQGLCTALEVYALLAALSGVEQAFFAV